MTAVDGRKLGALLVCAATLAVSGMSLGARRQLGTMGGLTDEWYPLGLNLALHGTLGLGSEPSLLRPPGYPAFVAGLVRLAAPPPVETSEYARRVRPLVYAAHALVLAATAVLLYLWLSTWIRPRCALAAALFLGLNPISLVLVGLLHYSLFHTLGLVACLYGLDRWTRGSAPRAEGFLASGMLFGLMTLVRPVTLPVPAFLLANFLGQAPSRGKAWRGALLFTAGMAITVAPWTARNLSVSGQFVPVNMQGSMVFWAATEKPLPWDADHYLWFELSEELLLIHSRVTGQPSYDFFTFLRYLPHLDAAHRSAALANLRDRPGVYLGNVVRSLTSFLVQTSTALPRAFVRLQGSPGGTEVPRVWFFRNGPDPLDATLFGLGLRVLFGVLTLLAAWGAFLGARDRDYRLLAPASVLACVMLAHGLTHYDLMHQYLRLPFLAVFAFYGLAGRAPPGPEKVGADRWALSDALSFGLVGASVALTFGMLSAG